MVHYKKMLDAWPLSIKPVPVALPLKTLYVSLNVKI